MTSTNPFLLTLPELMSAKKKLGQVAAFYDKEKMSMQGFTSKALNATEFRTQLRANLLVELTNAELGAIIMLFDKDGDGTVDTVGFINEFFKLGKCEKFKAQMHRKDDEARIARYKDKIAKKKAANVKKLLEVS